MSTSSATPRVTVITPAYNASATVAEAVASVLGQTMEELELIVVDDGSSEPITDSLLAVCDQRLRVIRTANRGVSAARNTALATARSPIVAQLDADDFWRPDHLEALLPAFDDPAVGLAYANAEIIGWELMDRAIVRTKPGEKPPDWLNDRSLHPINDLSTLYQANRIPSPAAMMRTGAVLAIGGYPTWLTAGEEYYVYIKLLRAGWRFAYVDRMSAVYRWPEPGRGVSYNGRRQSRQGVKLFSMLAVSSPPNRAIFTRLGGELVNVTATHVPATVAVGRRLRRVAQHWSKTR